MTQPAGGSGFYATHTSLGSGCHRAERALPEMWSDHSPSTSTAMPRDSGTPTRSWSLWLLGLACIVSASACGGGTTEPPQPDNLTGTWIGNYTGTPYPGVAFQAVLQLTQSGSNISGSLATNVGRSATVAGSVSSARFAATFNFTDACTGTASATADITNTGTRLAGTYTAKDCVGSYNGGFVLDKQ